MHADPSSNHSISKTYMVEKKSISLGKIESGTVRKFMNGAIYIESGTESDMEPVKKIYVNKDDTKKHFGRGENQMNLAKLVAKSIEMKLTEKKSEDREMRLQEAQNRYNIWLDKKRKEQTEKNRAKTETEREKVQKQENERKLRTLESELKYKLWLKKKEQQELEYQWKQLQALLEKD